MSHPVLSSAARRLSRQLTTASLPPCHRLFATSRPALRQFSASSDTIPVSRRTICNSLLYASPRSHLSRYNPRRAGVSSFSVPRAHRAAFSSSSIRPATKVVQNMRNDEEGKELLVDISSRAAERLREITDSSSSPEIQEENPYHHLRITVTSGGCHGFQYMMSLESASKIDAEEDTIFESDAAETTGEGSGSALVVMDEPSLELLSGSTVDYTTELIGSQFTIANNPRATSNCGCGTSFDVND